MRSCKLVTMPATDGPTNSARPHWVAQLGDARRAKLADNLFAFGRALRRAGMAVDGARIALAQKALLNIDISRRDDVGAALEAVLVSQAQDRMVFREMFAAFFKDPELAQQLLARLQPRQLVKNDQQRARPRVRAALAPFQDKSKDKPDSGYDLDAAMSASAMQRLKQADFNQLSSGEFKLIQQLVRNIPLAVPLIKGRRTLSGARGQHLHWGRLMEQAGRYAGDITRLSYRQRRLQALPLLVLIDTSGSMERYARTLLAFLHAATKNVYIGGRRQALNKQVFALGSRLTDLNQAFKLADTDAMLVAAAHQVQDFAGGTHLASSLQSLRLKHPSSLSGRRTLVLLVSDGLDTDKPELLAQELNWLKLHTRSLLWLNPLLRFEHYQPSARGAAVLNSYADAMLAVHNISHLESLAGAIARLIRQ